jgi:Fe-S-cluster containining protein
MSHPAEGHCIQCGACCHLPDLPPYVLPDELDLVDKEICRIVEAVFAKRPPGQDEGGQPCCFWNPETCLCRVYRQRPSACREFPAGSDLCLSCREKYGVVS